MTGLALSGILKVEDKDEQAALLLAYGGQRIDKAGKVYGTDSQEYTEAVDRWSRIIRSHLAYEK